MPLRLSQATLTLARHGRPLVLLLPLLLGAAGKPGYQFPGFTWGPGVQYPGWTLPSPDMLITAPQAPPEPLGDAAPPPPGGRIGHYVWDPGHWHWTGQDYVWMAGYYVERPYRGSTWVAGRWADDDRDGVWTYTPGHWR